MTPIQAVKRRLGRANRFGFEPPSADLSVTKVDAPDPVVAGTDLVYTLTVSNSGPGTSTDVVLTDELPSGVSFVSAVPTRGNCSDSSGTVTCSIDVLEPGGTVTTTLRTTVSSTTVGVISNSATVAGREQDPDLSNNTAAETTTVVTPPAVVAPLADVVVNEDAPDTVIDLSGTFADADGDALTLSVQANTDPALVSASLVGTSLTLGYAANRNGEADVVLRATDAAGLFVDDTIRVTVQPVNDAPSVADPVPAVAVAEDAADTALDVSTVFADVDIATNADVLTLSVAGNRNPGLVSASLSGTSASVVGTTLTLSYVTNQNGASTITLRATDKAGATVDMTLEIAVAAVNDPPTANNVAFVVTRNSRTTTLDVVLNDTTTPDLGEILTITTVSPGSAGGTVVVSGGGSTVDYWPVSGFVGTETFTYTVNDGTPGSDDTARVTIDVTLPSLATAVVLLTTGFNLVGTPMDFETTTTARDLAQMIAAQGGAVASILRWDAGFEAWLADFPGEKDFVIEPGRGYFLRLMTPPVNNSWIIPGFPFTRSVPIDLTTGFNLIGIPFATPVAGYDAKSLAQAVDPGGTVASILKWDAGYEAWLADFPNEKSFPIDANSGYFIRMAKPVAGFVP